MEIQEKILTHLSAYGKENKYRLARALKTDVADVTEALDVLEKEGKIEIKEGNAMLVKEKKPIGTKKVGIREEVKEKLEEEAEKEEVEVPKEAEEEPKEEVSEEPSEEEIPEHFGVKEEEKKVKGNVKFFNPNKGFGFITGDDRKDYYFSESSLKEGVAIKADDRVSFKVVQETQGPKAEEVEKISEGARIQYA